MIKKVLKEKRGITLIALVITIIVLLILAGVSIALLTGENGILTQASKSKDANEKGEAEEKITLVLSEWQIEKNKKDAQVIDSFLNNKVSLKELDRVTKNTNNTFTIDVKGYKAVIGTNGELIGEITKAVSLPYTEDTIPFLPTDDIEVLNNDLSTGLVIKDNNGNEWVWIEVPKSKMPKGLTFENVADYKTLEKGLQNYATAYRSSTNSDEYRSEYGLTYEKYENIKKTMLKSIYENGGFYIGRYETGTQIARSSEQDKLTTPVIKQDVYPYNFVTCKQAQELSEQLSIGNKTTSLLFGTQWDLVLKFIEEKGKLKDGTKITASMLNWDSTDWGNYSYYRKKFEITRGKYFKNNIWNKVEGSYVASGEMLTTGATDRNSALNIYDLAGNESEWVLEMDYADTRFPCIKRGGEWADTVNHCSAHTRRLEDKDESSFFTSFRTALY